jgi:hypothetical protein
MFATVFLPGDHVGIKDAPEFTGHPLMLNVIVDGGHEPIPMLAEVLVKLASSRDEPPSDEWFAQAFPVNGDAPGPKMYFANVHDVQTFVAQFVGLQLDEVLKVHAPAYATEAEWAMVKVAGGVAF